MSFNILNKYLNTKHADSKFQKTSLIFLRCSLIGIRVSTNTGVANLGVIHWFKFVSLLKWASE